jgi:peptide/nickel transport system substrate-binding protein
MDLSDEGGLNRRLLFKRGAQGAALLAGGNLLAACGSGGKSPATTGTGPAGASGPAAGGTPVKGGTLRVGMLSAGSTESVVVPKMLVPPDAVRLLALYDQLFITVPGGTAPSLATAAEPNADATLWTIKLRDGVTWHDGKPLTADDVVYSIKSWGSKGSYYAAQTNALVDVKKVRKRDRLTVEVPLVKPFAELTGFFAWPAALIIQDGTKSFTHPVGTGPFTFGSFKAGSSSTFPANPHYWGGAPHVDALVINSSFSDDAARMNAVISGQLDVAPAVPFALAKANAESGQIVIGNAPSGAFIPVIMRMNVPPFNDPRVVQAFKLAIDRDAVVNSVFAGFGKVSNDLPGATLPHFASDLTPVHDPEKAKALLKAAGQENLHVPFVSAPAVPGQDEMATVVSAQLKDIGVNAPVKHLPVDTYFTTASPAYMSDQRKLSTAYWQTFPPALGAFYDNALSPTGEFDETGWGHKPAQMKLINDAMAELDPAKAKEKWHAVQEQQLQEGGYLIPATYDQLDAYSKNIRGLATTSAPLLTFHKAWLNKQ